MRQDIDDAEAAGTETAPESKSVDILVQHCLPSVQRWAHGKIPRGSRGDFDTKDLVQEAALRMLKRRSLFKPRHAHSVQAYLRRTVLNLVRDEARRLARRPEPVAVCDELPSEQTGPLEITMRQELRARYIEALRTLRAKDQRLIVASIEGERHPSEIARIFGLPSPAAARVAVARACNRLIHKLSALK
jgi:RNA polymerase sigma-70 factor, ECF subfamily